MKDKEGRKQKIRDGGKVAGNGLSSLSTPSDDIKEGEATSRNDRWRGNGVGGDLAIDKRGEILEGWFLR
jgi:hypothetical protein